MVFLRAVATLALGIVVFGGLLVYLVAVNFTQRLEDPGVYNVAVSETGAYTRIYDEVLVDEALREWTGRLLGNIDIAAQDDAVDVLREVMPPSYLREQTADNIERLTGFLRYEVDDLEIYVFLEEPLERVEPAMLGKVHQFLDELEVVDPPSSDCSLMTLQRLAEASAAPLAQLSQGNLPQSVPSLKILGQECREREFDQWFDLVADGLSTNPQAAQILEGQRKELLRSFVDGDTRGFLKAVAAPLAGPLIVRAVEDVRRDLPPYGRIDLLEWLTDQPGTSDRKDIEAEAESVREALGMANGPVRLIVLATVVLGSLLLAAAHVPRPASMLRWPGITLLMGGAVSLVAGLALNSVLPGMVRGTVMNAVPFSGDVPVSAIDLAGDLLESFVHQATAGFVPATAVVMVLGVLLIAASLYYGRLTALARRFMPDYEGGSG